MSRVGKQIISLPAGVTADLAGETLTVKGNLGTLSRQFKSEIAINIEGNEIKLAPRGKSERQLSALAPLWGTYTSHVKNMVEGVTKGFTKVLLVEGVGFKAAVAGNSLNLELGFSHPIKFEIPKDLKVMVEKGTITITGFDKEAVGQFAAKVRALKPTEPYKGKGIKYSDEVVLRKQGKKSAA